MGLAFLNKVLTLQGLFAKPSNFHLCATSGISKQVKEAFEVSDSQLVVMKQQEEMPDFLADEGNSKHCHQCPAPQLKRSLLLFHFLKKK